MHRARGYQIALLAATLVVGAGCPGPPCDQDPLYCGEGEDFFYAPECELTGALEVTLGQGTDGFEALAPEQEPKVHEGAQGGHHLCLGLRVENPALEFPRLRVAFDVEIDDPERCAADDPACDPWVGTGRRDLVLGPELPLDGDGRIEETGFIVLLSLWPQELERRVRLAVEDPCGRTGAVDHVIPPAE